jgi:hypothetical protein
MGPALLSEYKLHVGSRSAVTAGYLAATPANTRVGFPGLGDHRALPGHVDFWCSPQARRREARVMRALHQPRRSMEWSGLSTRGR